MTIKPFAYRFLILSAAALFWQAAAADALPRAGESIFSDGKHVEYVVGDVPLIISAPHGGRLKPASMADRKRGTLTADMNTDRLAKAIAEAFHERTGKTPHVIICHVARTKVDCNRDLEEAAQGDPGATQVWNDFHGFIKQARDAVLSESDKGLYLDIHGHGHPEPMQELGYLLRNSQLKQEAAALNKLATRSSIHALANRSDTSFVELLRGATSFGALLEKKGFPAIPSPEHPDAGNEKFLSGGYNTARYGSRDGGTIDGLQIESPKKGVRDTDANRKAFAKAITETTIAYLKTHYNVTIPTKPPIPVNPNSRLPRK